MRQYHRRAKHKTERCCQFPPQSHHSSPVISDRSLADGFRLLAWFKFDFGGVCALTKRIRNWTGAPRSPQRTPDFLWSLMVLAHFMRLSLKKAAHAGVGGAPCRRSEYLSRIRRAKPTKAFNRSARKSVRNISFSAQVRFGEPGAPVQFLLGPAGAQTPARIIC